MMTQQLYLKLKTLTALSLLFCFFFSCNEGSLDKEKIAQDIKNVLELESKYYAAQEFDKLLEQYYQGDETTVIADLPLRPGEAAYVRGYDALVETFSSYKKEIAIHSFPPPIKTDWNINIEGNIVWCSYTEKYSANRNDLSVFKSAVLKKVKGKWKIVNLNGVIDLKNATLNIPINEFPVQLQSLLQHWQNEKS